MSQCNIAADVRSRDAQVQLPPIAGYRRDEKEAAMTVDPLVLDEDPTRWGVNPGHGLSPTAQGFLQEWVGVPTAVFPDPDWGSIVVPECALAAAQIDQLRSLLGDQQVHTDDASRRAGASGLGYLDLVARRTGQMQLPDVVVTPVDERQVGQLLTWCADNDAVVVPHGGGTSVVGGLRADTTKAVVALSTRRLDQVWDVDDESHLVTVGAGITGPELERHLATRHLTLGHYPQSWQRASIGGYAATRSAGQASTGYGRSDDMVESLTVVTPTGTVEVGCPPASAAGPDLRQVFIGSEGAFGVITRVTLRVRRAPQSTDYTAVVFPDYPAGLAAFRDLVQSGERADVMRLSDPEETAVTLAMSGPSGTASEALDRYLRLRGVKQPTMAILGWEGGRAQVKARHAAALLTLRRHGAVSLTSAVGKSWVRHRFSGPYLRDTLMDNGYLVETLETATRWSRVEHLRHEVADTLQAHLQVPQDSAVYVMSHVSHVYETGASLYFTVIACADQADSKQQWLQAKSAVMDTLVRNQATITHHHAVGRDHAPWLEAEIGPIGVRVLAAVKGAVDPQGILNPGVLGL